MVYNPQMSANQASEDDQISAKIAFHKSIRMLFRPIVRMAIRRGISVNDLYTWLKALYVEEAEHFRLKGRKQSASRIAVLTGLDRKEVAHLRELSKDVDALLSQETKRTNRALRAINAWRKDSRYLDDDHQPLPLPLNDGQNSFHQLAQEHCGDITPASVLSELQRAGLVEVDGKHTVRLTNRHYIPRADSEAQFALMGQAGQDLLNTASHNIEHPKDESRLQLSVAYDELSPATRRKLKKLIDKESILLLEKLDGWLKGELSLQEDTDPESRRAGVGIYYFEDPDQQEPNP